MSKGQHGNKEAKKPKQVRVPVDVPASPPVLASPGQSVPKRKG